MQLDCIEYAAQYFSQACTEGCLLDYLAAVKKLYEDRCPSDPKVDWDTFQLSLSMVSMARGLDAKEPDVHWKVGLSLKYDRSRRPSPFAISSQLGFGRTRWLEELVEVDEKRFAQEEQETVNADNEEPNDSPNDEGSSSHTHIDFLTPGVPDMGEDAHLFKLRRSESPDIIRVG